MHVLGAMKSSRDSTITSPSRSRSIICILARAGSSLQQRSVGLIGGLRSGLLTRGYLFQIVRGPGEFCPPAR